ncbi:MAG: asparagine synthase [Leifsonia sp.]
MWFSRRRRRKAPPFDYSTLPWAEPPEEEDAREEGVMLAEYSSRMTLKNRILVSVLGEDVDFDVDSFLPDARQAMRSLASEMRIAAGRVAEESAAAARLYGHPQDMHDYRSGDLVNLGLRERVNLAVAAELERRAGDDDYLRAFILAARDDAWDDVAGAIGVRLDLERPQSAVDANYKRTRKERMRMVRNIDLARLAIDRLDY